MAIFQLTNEAYRLTEHGFADAPAAPEVLYAARRDAAAFQILVCSDFAYSLNVTHEDWFSAKFARLVGSHERLRVAVSCALPVSLLIEEFLPDDDETKKADILLTQSVRESAAHFPSAVWAEIQTPADAAPGDYPITVSLYSSFFSDDEVCVATAQLTLHVAAYTLPKSKDYKFRLDLWQHTCNIARKHDVPLWSDAHFAVLEKYAASLGALGQKSITVCASNMPWSGQDCWRDRSFKGTLFEYSMIPVTRDKGGVFHYDFAPMQRYIDICTAAGISGDVEIFGLVNVWNHPDSPFGSGSMCPDHPESPRVRYLDEADGCMKYMRSSAEICDYIRALEQYFITTGQIERARIAADEPGDVERYRTSLNLLHEIAPHFRCKCAINHAEFIGEFGDQIDDFAPYLGCVRTEYDTLMEYKKTYPEKHYLWYVCCGPTLPNAFLRSAPLESRMIGLYTYRLGLDGFLRWNYTVWPDDPRHDIRYSAFEAGDTNFVYPAYNGDVLLSLRYKNLQRGIMDYEMLCALREKADADTVDELLDPVLYFRNVKEQCHLKQHFTTDYNTVNTMKARVLAALDA